MPELRLFLGLVTYYQKFLLQVATILEPLYELLHARTEWEWGVAQQQALEEVKALTRKAEFLAHYDPDKPLVLECDASAVGIGAVHSHGTAEGMWQPIGFRCRILTDVERKYSQIEKEALVLFTDLKGSISVWSGEIAGIFVG